MKLVHHWRTSKQAAILKLVSLEYFDHLTCAQNNLKHWDYHCADFAQLNEKRRTRVSRPPPPPFCLVNSTGHLYSEQIAVTSHSRIFFFWRSRYYIRHSRKFLFEVVLNIFVIAGNIFVIAFRVLVIASHIFVISLGECQFWKKREQ